MLHVFASLLIGVLLLQSPALDSQSPKERQAAIDQMAVLGNRDAIPALSAAYKKEPRSDLRAEIVAAFGRIRDKSAIAPLSEALRSDLDKNVRLQSIDSLLRLYIQIDETGGIRTIFNKVKSVFSQPDHPVINPGVQVDAETTAVLSEAMQKDFSDDVRIEAA